MEDVRYYVMSSIRENVGKVMAKGVGQPDLLLSSSALAVFVCCFHCHNVDAVFFYLENVTWFAEQCLLVLFLSGRAACISGQCIHTHV